MAVCYEHQPYPTTALQGVSLFLSVDKEGKHRRNRPPEIPSMSVAEASRSRNGKAPRWNLAQASRIAWRAGCRDENCDEARR
ncbi:hypothetical protein B296_00018536, partial [Ensete ventricosum]